MTEPYEDVSGAFAADRAMRARQYAAMLLIANYTGRADLQSDVLADFCRAGLTSAEVAAAKAELREVYNFDDRSPDESLEVLGAMLEPQGMSDSRPGDAGIEEYRRSDGLAL